MRSLLWISVLSAALAGCVADAGVGVRATYVAPPPPIATVTVVAQPAPAPDVQASVAVEEDDAPYVEPASMVYVSPDVQVIEDYDYPVFFTGGLYWRNDGGVWYSSSWHDRGWAVQNRDIPVAVVHIDRPEAYVHFHADVHARVGQPGYRNPNRVVVNHPAGPPPHRMQPNQHPVVGHEPPREVGHGPVEHPAPAHPMAEHPPEHPMEANHPAETPVRAPEHPMAEHAPVTRQEPAKTGGYGAQPAAKQPAAKAPAYKAPPPPPKKKK